MTDNLKITHPQDAQRINLGQDHEVEYWTKELEVSEQELRDAVEAVGTYVEAVRKYLNK